MTTPPAQGHDVPPLVLAFKVSGLRAVLHLPEPVLTGLRFVRLVAQLGPWAERLSSDPQLLPGELIRDDDFPLVLWRSPGNEWQCEVRRRRVDLMWRLANPDGPAGDPVTFFNEAAESFLTIQDALVQRTMKLAAVLERYSLCDGSAAMALARHFCRGAILEAPIKRSDNFTLSSHKVFDLDGIRVNSWVHNKSSRLATDNRDIVMVTTDINTVKPEGNEAPQVLDTVRFFRAAVATSAEVVNLYYRGSTV